jgi:hypothetical protein
MFWGRSVTVGWFFQLLLCCVAYMALRVIWWILSCFFHCFCIFLGKNPPCGFVLSISCCSGGLAQISSNVFDNLDIRSSSLVMVCIHSS